MRAAPRPVRLALVILVVFSTALLAPAHPSAQSEPGHRAVTANRDSRRARLGRADYPHAP